MYSTDQVLCLWNSDRILMGSDKIYNRKSASSVDIHIWSDNKHENGPYTESASHLLLIEHWEIKSFKEWEELIQGLSPSQKVPDRVLEGGFPITRFISYYVWKYSFLNFLLKFNMTSLFAYQRDYEEFEEGEYSGLVETDNDCTDYMSPLMSPTTQESQLTMSPVEDRVVSPCSELDLDTSGIFKTISKTIHVVSPRRIYLLYFLSYTTALVPRIRSWNGSWFLIYWWSLDYGSYKGCFLCSFFSVNINEYQLCGNKLSQGTYQHHYP